ncbi:hypothetical protein [Nocardia arizonensis]|uniref:hypothetical protein n=1 Tax=Nocardia arizonensis TaxID=1141647 RepID=UPI0006D26848|nr:hypothetical protein [Nocardia arizonensis]
MSAEPTPPTKPTPPPPAPGPAAEPPAVPEVITPAPAPPAAVPAPAPDHDPVALATLVADLRRELDQARTGADTARDRAAQQAREDLVQEIGRAIGLVPEDSTDPEQVIAELTDRATAADRKLRDYRIKDALLTAATTQKADHALLMPYLRGTGALDDLDPETADFTTRLDTLVTDALTTNPKLAATPTVPRSGGEFTAGNATPPAPEQEEDIDAIRRKVRASIADTRT